MKTYESIEEFDAEDTRLRRAVIWCTVTAWEAYLAAVVRQEERLSELDRIYKEFHQIND